MFIILILFASIAIKNVLAENQTFFMVSQINTVNVIPIVFPYSEVEITAGASLQILSSVMSTS